MTPRLDEPWWVSIIKAVIIINLVMGAFAYLTLAERKVMGRMQLRYGPNRAGPFGLLQPIADLVKLIRKESFFPASSRADALYIVISGLSALAGIILVALGTVAGAAIAAFRTGQTDLGETSPDGRLAGKERRAASRATLLTVPVGEERAFLGNPVDVGRAVAHHAPVVGADVPVADVIAPDNEDVRPVLLPVSHGALPSR